MYGRFLKLWRASHGYGDRATGRDEGKLGRLVLIDISQWSDVRAIKRVEGVGKACSSCRGPRKKGVAEVSSGGVGGSRRGNVGVCGCKTSRRRRDRYDWRVGQACSSYRGSSTNGGEGSSGWGDVGVSCKNSRRRRDRCNQRVGKACTVAGAPAVGQKVYWRGLRLGRLTGRRRWVGFWLANSRSMR